jgi:hypothetical protein
MKKNVSQESDNKHVVDGMPALYQESTDKTIIMILSRNRPNYKNKSTKTIAGAIKFTYLSSYNPGSPMKSQGISNQPTYKPRS